MRNTVRPRSASESGGGWDRLFRWPAAFMHYLAGKWKGWSASKQMLEQAEGLVLDGAAVAELTVAWTAAHAAMKPPSPQAIGMAEASATLGVPPEAGTGANAASSGSMHLAPVLGLSDGERAIVHRIRHETQRLNRNNVTRTEAYRAIYGRCPELHWAMLAHMVSRNGGWCMTDLQGELIPRLLGPEQREPTFRFLERANALIFQDAYPQLLLYEAGQKLGRDLSRLLPAFGVSRFMQPAWAQFCRRKDPVPLTIALIVNEQHYIEGRVVQHPYYRKHVLGKLFFGMQSLLQLNQVIFPYRFAAQDAQLPLHAGEDIGLRAAGLVLENFGSLRERIAFGKRLYAMLFGVPEVREGVHRFARQVRHTGSRADYAPELFAPIRHKPPERPYRERLIGLRLRPGAEPLFSPRLADAWADLPVEPAEPGDWFDAAGPGGIAAYFAALPLPSSFEMTHEYGFGLSKVELAVMTAEELGAGRSG